MSKVKPAVQPVLTPEQAAVVADLDRIANAAASIRERWDAIAASGDQAPIRNLHKLSTEVAIWAAGLPDAPTAPGSPP